MKGMVLLFFLMFQLLLSPVQAEERPYREGEVLIKYKTGATQHSKQSLADRHALKTLRSFRRLKNIHHIRLAEGRDVLQAVEDLKKEGNVEFAEPNYVRKPFFLTPDDQAWQGQWGMVRVGMADAWSITQGSAAITVAVIDTGVDFNHPDLAANIWTNRTEMVGIAGIDDDSNGKIDDLQGWNFFCDSTPCSGDKNPMDTDGHGTHVAGIIGARGNNNMGVAGVGWTVKIMPLRFMDSSGGTAADVVDAIDYAIQMKARIINASFGHTTFSQAEYNAVSDAGDAGVLFVAAAGNNGSDNDGKVKSYPSSYELPNIISVASTDVNDSLSSFSNYGAAAVHIAAPGENIGSTVAQGLSDLTGILVISGADTPYKAKRMEYGGQIPAQGVTGRLFFCGYGAAQEEFPPEVSGNIALIARGSSDGISAVTFSQKTHNAMNAGAIAAIIYDNQIQNTIFSGTLGSEGDWIPVAATTNSDGQALKALAGSSVTLAYPYDSYSGTSMAAPFVSGAAALLLSEKPGLTPVEVKNIILQSADPLPSLAGKVASGGRLNVYRALQAIRKPPFELALKSGWNFISFPALPATAQVEQVFAGDLLSKVRIIWGYDNSTQQWKKWKPDNQEDNRLTQFEFGKGYWIYVETTTTIDLTGWLSPDSPVVRLYGGWNLVGYGGTEGAPLSSEMGPLSGKWSAAWNWTDGQWSVKNGRTSPAVPMVQPLSAFYQWKAYWIHMDKGVEIDWAQ